MLGLICNNANKWTTELKTSLSYILLLVGGQFRGRQLFRQGISDCEFSLEKAIAPAFNT